MSSPAPHASDRSLLGRIIDLFLRGDLAGLVIAVSLAAGLLAVTITPREEEPQIVVPLADVHVQAPGLSVEEVERQVATRLEKLLAQIDGVEHVYSMSLPGRAVVTVRFYVGEDREDSLVKIYNKIHSNTDLVPPDVTAWVVKPIEIDDVPILIVTLWSERPGRHRRLRPATHRRGARDRAPGRVRDQPHRGRGRAAAGGAGRARPGRTGGAADLGPRGGLGARRLERAAAGRGLRPGGSLLPCRRRRLLRGDRGPAPRGGQRGGREARLPRRRGDASRRPRRARPATAGSASVRPKGSARGGPSSLPGRPHRRRQAEGHQRGPRGGAGARAGGGAGRHPPPGGRPRAHHPRLRRDRQRQGQRAARGARRRDPDRDRPDRLLRSAGARGWWWRWRFPSPSRSRCWSTTSPATRSTGSRSSR